MNRLLIVTLLFTLLALGMSHARSHSKNGHEYVDLGLPSGTLWATCNIGADKPEDRGDYFMWGEITPLELDSIYIKGWGITYYDSRLSNRLNEMPEGGSAQAQFFSIGRCYKYYIDSTSVTSHRKVTKYCTNPHDGIVDGRTELEPEDDAAFMLWGSHWRTPSQDQIKELVKGGYTKYRLVEQNGILGCLIMGIKEGYTDKYLFLPFTGKKSPLQIKDVKSTTNTPAEPGGCYWLREYDLQICDDCYYFTFTEENPSISYFNTAPRLLALPIRPVWQEKK